MRRSGEIDRIELGRVGPVCKTRLRGGIDREFAGRIIIDLEGSDTNGGRLFKDGPYGLQRVVVAEERVIVEKDQNGRMAQADAEVAAPGHAEIVGCKVVLKRDAGMCGDEIHDRL